MPARGRQVLHREAPGAPTFQGLETCLGFNKCSARQLSHGKLHTSGVGFASHKENWGNTTIQWTLTAQLKSTWMAKGIINLIKAPFIPEASGGKAGGTSSYKRSLAGQRLLPLVGRTQIKTLCERTSKKKHPWDRFCLLVFAGSPRCNVKPVIYTSGTVLANL